MRANLQISIITDDCLRGSIGACVLHRPQLPLEYFDVLVERDIRVSHFFVQILQIRVRMFEGEVEREGKRGDLEGG